MKLIAKLAAGVAAAAAVLGAAQASQAAVINWTLSNGTFDDGGMFFGTFDYDTVTDAITNWDVTTTGTVATHYRPGSIGFGDYNNAYDNGGGPTFVQGFFVFGVGFDLTNIPLATAGTVDHLTGGETSFIFIQTLGSHEVTDGQAVGVLAGAVPEPAAWSLMITGAGLAGATLRLQRRRARTAA